MMDLIAFVRTHVPQILAVIILVTYGVARNKFTTGGVFAGIFVAVVHMLHPWPAFFWSLFFFVVFGTLVTKVGHKAKEHLTQSSTGGGGGEGARAAAQVFANTACACVLVLLHLYLLSSTPFISSTAPISAGPYFPILTQLLPIGIIAQYAAVAADTFSSELGILAKSTPFLITAPWRRVPKGTNGGVTIDGLLYGALGSVLLSLVAAVALYVSPPHITLNLATMNLLITMGLAGSVIDSVLGSLVQATVTDKQTGRVIEGPGGTRVKVAVNGSRVQRGWDLLTNNGVNLAMATITSCLAMSLAYVTGLTVK